MKTVIPYHSQTSLSTKACQEITVCLTSEWAARTVSGKTAVTATVESSGRNLGSSGMRQDFHYENPRCKELFQYSLVIDLSQFLEETPGNPYVPDCDDIIEIVPFGCLVEAF